MKQLLMGDDPGRVLRDMMRDGSLRAFEPSLADLKMVVPAGFHHKENFEHSVKVLEQAIALEPNGPDLVLRAAALFHDIGKPATRKLGGKKTVSFDGHESVGARMVVKILRRHGFSAAEVEEVSALVALHMRSHGFERKDWTDAGVRRLMADVGSKETMDRLVIIFYADVTSGKPEQRRKFRASVDALVVEMERVRRSDARKALRPALDGHKVMELFGLAPGKSLGVIMAFLNSDEGVHLSAAEAASEIAARFRDEIVEAGGKV